MLVATADAPCYTPSNCTRVPALHILVSTSFLFRLVPFCFIVIILLGVRGSSLWGI